MITKRIATTETIKIYRAKGGYSLSLYYFAGLLLSIFGLSLVIYFIQALRQKGALSIFDLLLFIIFVFIVAVTIRSIRGVSYSTYLLPSDDGISYRAGSREMLCPWNEVVSFVERPLPHLIVSTGGRSHFRYIMTKNPDDDPSIPLYIFAYSPNSELAKELRRYLPHLFS